MKHFHFRNDNLKGFQTNFETLFLQVFVTFYFLKKSTFDDSTKDIPRNLHESSDSKEDDLYTKFLQICFISSCSEVYVLLQSGNKKLHHK